MTEQRAGLRAGGVSWNSTDGATTYKLAVVRDSVRELVADGEQLGSVLRQAAALCECAADENGGHAIWARRARALCYLAEGAS